MLWGSHQSPWFGLGPGFSTGEEERHSCSCSHQVFLSKCDSHLHVSGEKIPGGLQHLVFSEEWVVNYRFWSVWLQVVSEWLRLWTLFRLLYGCAGAAVVTLTVIKLIKYHCGTRLHFLSDVGLTVADSCLGSAPLLLSLTVIWYPSYFTTRLHCSGLLFNPDKQWCFTAFLSLWDFCRRHGFYGESVE